MKQKSKHMHKPTGGFLGLGSVVYVNDGTVRLMIIGRVMQAADSGEIYDYAAVMFPAGMQESGKTFLFNQEEIREVVHYGLVDEEEERYNVLLQQQTGRPGMSAAA